MKNPSPSLVISLIALFVALGGTGYAAITVTGKVVKNGSLTGKDVKKNSLGGKQIKERSLGQVRRAADAARLGGSTADRYLKSGSAAGGALTGSYPNPTLAPAPLIPLALGGGWTMSDRSPVVPSAVKDHAGIVHLAGSVTAASTGGTIATLPPGYRPADRPGATEPGVWLSAASTNGGAFDAVCTLAVYPGGSLFVESGCSAAHISLDGLSFRASG